MGIKIRNLTFAYSESEILKNVNIEVKDGEFVGILGPTGSGKTTFTLCLNGVIPHLVKGRFSGDVEVSGKNTKLFKVFDLAKTVGMVFQDPDSQIFSVMVEDEISFGLENMGLRKDEISRRVSDVLNALEIGDIKHSETFTLSQGQKQKVCMASVLAMEPEILILDEPTSQLDFKSTKEIYDILGDIHRKGKTIMLVEHKVDWLLRYADRILVMDKGSFILDGKPSEVLRNPEIESKGIEVPKIFRLERFLEKKGIRIDFDELVRV